MDTETTRKNAIELYLGNNTPTVISRVFKKSRSWVYKWIRRFQGNSKGDWYKEESKRPKRIKKKLVMN